MDPAELLAIADRVLAEARGDEQVEVVAGHSVDTEVRVYDGDVESFTSASTQGVGIRVIRDGRQGFAYSGSLDPAALRDTLGDARDNATFSSPDPFVGLAAPDGMATADLHLFDASLAGRSPTDKIDLALELERRIVDGDDRIFGIESAEYADSIDVAVIVSTAGIRSVSRETAASLIGYSLAEADGEVTTGFGYSIGRGFDELDVAVAAEGAVQRAVRQLGARRTRSQRLTVVFDPWVTAQFLGVIGESFSGIEVLRGRSFLADRLGETVAAASVTLVDDPTDARFLAATDVDAEGLATRRNVLIERGEVKGFVHDSYSARGLGVASTGSAVRGGYRSTPSAGVQSLALEPGTTSPAELIAAVGDGIYIVEVSGLHSGVNPVSGDFSTGVEAVMIRGGELAEPVKEVTIASTLQRMLADVIAVGADLTPMPIEAAGLTLAIGDVTLSGD
ncbi:MAG: TldD/PmbA family protein [Actinobacteria bacterium]|nr:TldD/PmbA family protein [Actinomycetota bacterium]